jgi:hypothetical protein
VKITLTQGYETEIDDEDFELVSRHKWYVDHGVSNTFARTSAPKKVRLHRLILNAQPGEMVVHLNGDGLDNRRANLQRRKGWV